MNFVFTRFRRTSQPLFTLPARPVLAVAMACALGSMQSLAAGITQEASVGRVSMLIGQAYIIRADEAVPVNVGDEVHVTDTIETSSGGFVHIRFVDNALITVRPYSSLQIVRYDYDAQAPENSAVKLLQQEGVTRYISGKAAQNAKQNFRLNTPIAAIGVRGTDFVVSASGTTTRALVNEGAIVVAPYSADCSADALGPCQDAVEALSQQILEMSSGAAGATTALLPANPAQTEQALAAAAVTAPAENKEKAGKTDIYTDTVSTRAVNQKLVASSNPRPIPPALEYTPDQALTSEALTTDRQLVWGRWYEANLDSARITVPRQVALEGSREITVGNLMHGLYRNETGAAVMSPGLGVVKFELAQAEAQFSAIEGNPQLMDVLGGNLQIDFQQSTFFTDLKLSHAATGRIEFRDNGVINDEGIFRSLRVDPTQRAAGAVSLDGQEAGYLFEKILNGGTIEGLTLWNNASK